MKNLSSKIEKSNNKNGSTPNNADYQMAISILKGYKEYVAYSTGSGKWSNTKERCPEIYLRVWGIDFETGNDAPRGGKVGNFIQLSKKGMLQTKVYRAEVALQLAKEKAARLEQKEIQETKLKVSESKIIENIKDNKVDFDNAKIELAELKANGNKEEWHVLANKMVQFACNNDFSLGWSNIYKLIQNN
jgi:hypothetical protein